MDLLQQNCTLKKAKTATLLFIYYLNKNKQVNNDNSELNPLSKTANQGSIQTK